MGEIWEKYVAYLENLGNGCRSLVVESEEKILVRRSGS
jgi:hypothetical protein